MPEILEEKQEVFVTENYEEPKDPNDDKLMTLAEYKEIYEPKAETSKSEKTASSKAKFEYKSKKKPEREMTRWELMKNNRKSKTRMFSEAMMERTGLKTGRWDYASGQVIDPDVIVLGHEPVIEYKPG